MIKLSMPYFVILSMSLNYSPMRIMPKQMPKPQTCIMVKQTESNGVIQVIYSEH